MCDLAYRRDRYRQNGGAIPTPPGDIALNDPWIVSESVVSIAAALIEVKPVAAWIVAHAYDRRLASMLALEVDDTAGIVDLKALRELHR